MANLPLDVRIIPVQLEIIMRKIERLLLGAGTMRAGTTWLWNIIKDHPEIYFTPEKEIHFLHDFYRSHLGQLYHTSEFPVRVRYWIADPSMETNPKKRKETLIYLMKWGLLYFDHRLEYDYYHSIFSLRGDEKYCCDMSNLTSHLSMDQLEDVKGRFDEVKVFYVVRDPLKRLWSHFSYTKHTSWPEVPFREDAWTKEMVEQWLKGEDALIRPSFEYTKAIDKLLGVFGDNFKVIYYEDLLRDTRETLRELEDFLEISRFDYDQEKIDYVLNNSTPKDIPMWDAFVEGVMPTLREEVRKLSNYTSLHPDWENYED